MPSYKYLLPPPADLMRMPAGSQAVYKVVGMTPTRLHDYLTSHAAKVGAKIKLRMMILVDKSIHVKKLEAFTAYEVTVVKSGPPKKPSGRPKETKT